MENGMSRREKLFIIGIVVACLGVLAGFMSRTSNILAADDRLIDTVTQGEGQQVQVRVQMRKAVAELAAMIDELDRNGIAGDELQTLKSIRDIMSNLSDKDMDKVIQLLQAARSDADPAAARRDVTAAVVTQKFIISQMNQLLIKYRQQQELYDISLQFTEFADRQNENLQKTKTLVKEVKRRNGNKATDKLNDDERNLLSDQAGDEKNLRDETGALVRRLEQVMIASDGDTAERLRKSLRMAADNKMSEALKQATDLLTQGEIYSAASSEKTARDCLYALGQMIAPDQDSAEKIRRAIQAVASAIIEQKQIVAQTREVNPSVRRSPDALNDLFSGIEDRQGDLVDRVDRTRGMIDNVAPAAAETLKAAQDRMQDSRQSLTALQRDPSLLRENDALAKLEETMLLLADQLAKVQQKPTGDKEDQARALQEKLVALRINQQKLNGDTAVAAPKLAGDLSKKQSVLQQTARDLQSEASAPYAESAREIALASGDMGSAAASLLKAVFADAAAPQKTAVEHLLKAEALLDAAIVRLDDAKKELAKLEGAREQVAKLMQDQQQVSQKTDNIAAKDQANKDQKPDANKLDAQANKDAATQPSATQPSNQDLARQQDAVAKATDDANKNLSDAAKDAYNALNAAKQDMNAASQDLAQSHPHAAQAPQQKAMQDLVNAQQAIDNKIRQDQRAMGQQPDASKPLADAAQAIAQARQQVQDAQSQMNNQPQDQQPATSQQLAQAQQQVANQLQQAQQQQPNNQALQQAQQAAQNAAKQLNQDQVPQAVQFMQQAQKAMQQAQQDQPQPGQPQPGQPQPGQPQPGQPQPGQPQPGQPQPGQPQPGQPQPGQPQPGQPQPGQPQPGQPQPGQPQPGQPQPGQPQPGQPQPGQPQPGQPQPGQPSISQISQQQAQIMQQAQWLSDTAAPAQAMQQAANEMAKAASDLTKAQASDQGLPQQAQQAMQQAADDAAKAAADAQAGDQPDAQAKAQAAQDAMAKAQAAVAMAQNGMESGEKSDHHGLPDPSDHPGKADEKNAHKSNGDRKDAHGTNGTGDGGSNTANGASSYLGLPARDREAIKQAQNDKYPQEYGPMIEQYLKNLSDQENKR